MTTHQNLIRRFFSDKNGKLTIWQRPNIPLLIWLVATVLSHILHPGDWQTLIAHLSKAAIIVWAIMEVYPEQARSAVCWA